MPATAGDNLRYPVLADPGHVPQDLLELATDVQAGLNKRMPTQVAQGTCTPASGWKHNTSGPGGFVVYKTGQLCIGRGLIQRATSDLTVAADGQYQLATAPAGYRPVNGVRVASSWLALTGDNIRPVVLTIEPDGVITLVAPASGVIRADYQWVSLAGVAWITS